MTGGDDANGPDIGEFGGRWLARDLSVEEQRRWDDLISADPDLAAEMESMAAVAEAVRDLPPELFIDGPAPDAALIARRVVRSARDARRPTETLRDELGSEGSTPSVSRMRRLLAVAAAAVVVAAAGGVLAGQAWERRSTTAGPTPTPTITVTVTPAPPDNAVTASSTNAATGAGATVQLIPAAGWVRVTVTATGIPEGEQCNIWVESTTSERQLAGSWLVSAQGAQNGTTLNGSAIVPPDQVASVTIENTAGTRFVTVPI